MSEVPKTRPSPNKATVAKRSAIGLKILSLAIKTEVIFYLSEKVIRAAVRIRRWQMKIFQSFLQAVGFGRFALLASLLQESTAATLMGALAAATVGLLWLDGLTVPFSIGAFSLNFEPDILALGFGVGVGLGIIGALPPAWSCLRPKLIATLRAA